LLVDQTRLVTPGVVYINAKIREAAGIKLGDSVEVRLLRDAGGEWMIVLVKGRAGVPGEP
jgi:bifunctional DNA-binding transcriptional regulator/antitoxin component of YhaV-PrlF toxin-antitoxin module